MMTGLILVLVYVLCGIGGAGFFYADFHGRYPTVRNHRDDLAAALLFGFLGPVALVLGFFMSGFGRYGWSLWRKNGP
jgi:cytochrome bd-type quinol oxidase subunit 1